ncbi:hypothetical protein EIN_429510 [Entamoeba invadens IP1]|uniref:Uncharacterized protein n=1 Tax=Entamoeba invadens IP1 TaxID=370355 RepID=A0A0A1UF06_ENTIV|nr:hypothetical protein EIN_429510 [Entamoeba invadens IP1]ELP95175.1 hypothetical protein EIN_429510 [Entamoeba invadens IP1]|eukprot:XP_004261946.1 hypothetical protein EIN_429510 [Entamoeba invadens IP1]
MYKVQQYEENDNFKYTPQQTERMETQEAIVDFLKKFYQIIVPVISAVMAVVKLGFALRLSLVIMSKSWFWVKRDWQIKLGPQLNPYHLVLLDLLSCGFFCVIPIYVFIIKKAIDQSFLLKNILACVILFVVLLFFTYFIGAFWLIGINIVLYTAFFWCDYVLKNVYNVSIKLNKAYSV